MRPGDRVLAVNGLVPRDVVDVRLDAAGPQVEIDVEREGSRLLLVVEKDWDEDLGIEFERADFDRLKTCNNRCEFCFISGLPLGLRRSLYIKDDDFRYSFLYGSFVTLTNLSAAEWSRLIFQRLSPLRVSVHATDVALRRELLGNPAAPSILDQLDELGSHGIRVHAQIVLMPGRNDGPVLERTIADLVARHPTVESAAVVPVGLTAHSHAAHTRAVALEDAAAAIGLVAAAQRRCRRNLGAGVVYASDELYLLAGRPVPSARSYDGYLQLHNGVGLVRLFCDEWKRAARRLPPKVDPPRSVCWGTGALMAPVLRDLAANLEPVGGLTVDVVPIQNSLFGGQVTVAGLLPARDVVGALNGKRYDRMVLPRSMLDAPGQQTIDGWTVGRIAEALDMDVIIATGPRDLLERTLCAAS
jgi:putative radical SAM enzyme (TIGR03279 family)